MDVSIAFLDLSIKCYIQHQKAESRHCIQNTFYPIAPSAMIRYNARTVEQLIVYILAGLVVILTGWSVYLTVKYRKLYAKASLLFSDGSNRNLAKIIEDYMKSVKDVEDHCFAIDNELKKVRKMAEEGYQKLGFVRYNPFGDVGGNLSFSIALLDDKNSGFVISSIHSREGTRVYSKSVHNSLSDYNLSEEEKGAIALALKGKGERNV
jgi:hypothetical protein